MEAISCGKEEIVVDYVELEVVLPGLIQLGLEDEIKVLPTPIFHGIFHR